MESHLFHQRFGCEAPWTSEEAGWHHWALHSLASDLHRPQSVWSPQRKRQIPLEHSVTNQQPLLSTRSETARSYLSWSGHVWARGAALLPAPSPLQPSEAQSSLKAAALAFWQNTARSRWSLPGALRSGCGLISDSSSSRRLRVPSWTQSAPPAGPAGGRMWLQRVCCGSAPPTCPPPGETLNTEHRGRSRTLPEASKGSLMEENARISKWAQALQHSTVHAAGKQTGLLHSGLYIALFNSS